MDMVNRFAANLVGHLFLPSRFKAMVKRPLQARSGHVTRVEGPLRAKSGRLIQRKSVKKPPHGGLAVHSGSNACESCCKSNEEHTYQRVSNG